MGSGGVWWGQVRMSTIVAGFVDIVAVLIDMNVTANSTHTRLCNARVVFLFSTGHYASRSTLTMFTLTLKIGLFRVITLVVGYDGFGLF